jgi:hypothetical protein
MRRALQMPVALVPALLTAVMAALVSFAPVAAVVPGCAAAGSNHAPLVVEHANGSVVTRCVAFDSGLISGEELLNRSGVAWSGQTFSGFGAAVCALDAEPERYASCPGKDHYWAVFVSRGGGPWQLANIGISALTLADGDAEGFRYVPSAGTPSAPVAPGVCSPPAVTATAHAGATAAATIDAPAGVTGRESPAPGVAGIAAVANPPSRPSDGSPGSGSDLDLGLLAAAVAGGGLAGLALLRLLASWMRPR